MKSLMSIAAASLFVGMLAGTLNSGPRGNMTLEQCQKTCAGNCTAVDFRLYKCNEIMR
jgi:hypothetical protein